ncbi:MAG: hypothetical protein ACXWZE_08820 [Candidatus Binatia bacterium]
MDTKPLIQVGIACIFLGIVAFTYRGDADTSREQTAQIWTVQAGADAMHTLALSPLLAGLVLAGGIGLVAFGIRKSA